MRFYLTLAFISVFSVPQFAAAEAKKAAPASAVKKAADAKVVKPQATPEPEEAAPVPAPFESEEDIDYTAASPGNMLGFAKTSEFIGVINRPYSTRKNVQQADVYAFPKTKNLVIDKSNCEKIVEKLVGPLKTITLRHEKTEIYKSTFGSACELSLKDPDKDALAPERRIYVVNVKKDLFAFYFHFKPKALPSDSTDIRTFLRGLK